jgi:hypothetical protein
MDLEIFSQGFEWGKGDGIGIECEWRDWIEF